jgi:hypothetical protein
MIEYTARKKSTLAIYIFTMGPALHPATRKHETSEEIGLSACEMISSGLICMFAASSLWMLYVFPLSRGTLSSTQFRRTKAMGRNRNDGRVIWEIDFEKRVSIFEVVRQLLPTSRPGTRENDSMYNLNELMLFTVSIKQHSSYRIECTVCCILNRFQGVYLDCYN